MTVSIPHLLAPFVEFEHQGLCPALAVVEQDALYSLKKKNYCCTFSLFTLPCICAASSVVSSLMQLLVLLAKYKQGIL